ncbi:MAG: hypothetical protein D6722_12320 [Bacteroidetes bacterium]|nr:MAG: hypothetical protein D6722_12320 [Bacteroidota bacterium]
MFAPIRLPFFIDNLYGGFAKVNGILSRDRQFLTLEFQVADNVLGGLLKGRPKEIRLPLKALASVEYKQNWFVARMILRAYRLGDLAEIPNAESGEAKLSIKRKDRKVAREMASSLNLALSEIRLAQMDEDEGTY